MIEPNIIKPKELGLFNRKIGVSLFLFLLLDFVFAPLFLINFLQEKKLNLSSYIFMSLLLIIFIAQIITGIIYGMKLSKCQIDNSEIDSKLPKYGKLSAIFGFLLGIIPLPFCAILYGKLEKEYPTELNISPNRNKNKKIAKIMFFVTLAIPIISIALILVIRLQSGN